MVDEKKVPIGVKIISVLFILAGLLRIYSLISIFLVWSIISQSKLLIITHIISPVSGIFGIFIGIFLWKGKNWARITSIILTSFGIILVILYAPFIFDYNYGLQNFLLIFNSLIVGPSLLPFSQIFSGLDTYSINLIILGYLVLFFNLWIIGYLLFSSKVREAFS
ncbi:MAG: hypothetical protein AABX26_03330 [Nanoarchaeota archaeon]